MKYFLSFKKEINGIERLDFVPNDLIHCGLNTNNNLSALCKFTGRFESEEELKKTIIKLVPAFEKNKDSQLVIASKRTLNGVEETKYNSVIYSAWSYYLNYDNLLNLIVSKVYEPFFESFFNHYQGHSYLSKELYALYEAVKSDADYRIIVAKAKIFLNKALYGRSGLEFTKLYKMVVFISSVLGSDIQFLAHKANESSFEGQPTSDLKYSSLSEVQEFEAEWLERRARLRSLGQW